MLDISTEHFLHFVLANKSTEQLENLLALDFLVQIHIKPHVKFIMTVLEILDKREGNTPEKQAQVDEAWKNFQNTILIEM